VGVGVYANNASCAVSCTGQGEAFMRVVAGYDLSALVEYRGLSVEEAARTVIFERLPALQGRGGLIALDPRGRMALPFNTDGMYRGWIDQAGRAHTAIYETANAWPAF
jgi:beta-aspartyl-peptidase (threonine type)